MKSILPAIGIRNRWAGIFAQWEIASLAFMQWTKHSLDQCEPLLTAPNSIEHVSMT